MVAPKVLRIAVSDSAPFAFKVNDQWEGLMIDVWNQVALRRGIKVEFVPAKFKELNDLFAAGKVDVGPPTTISAHVLKDRLFSIPILSSSLCIVTLPRENSTLRAAFHQFVGSGVGSLLLAILGLNFAIGVMLWLIERKQNASQFGGRPEQGLGSAVWCAITTMMTVGYGDKVPITWAGRLLCFVVMLTGVVIISLFTATAGAALTVSHLEARVNSLEDLKKSVVVTTNNSPAADYLRNNSFNVIFATSFDDALKKLSSGQAAAFVHDRIRVQSRLKSSETSGAVILPISLREDYFACVLAPNSPYQAWINQALEDVLESDAWPRIRGTYLTL